MYGISGVNLLRSTHKNSYLWHYNNQIKSCGMFPEVALISLCDQHLHKLFVYMSVKVSHCAHVCIVAAKSSPLLC